MAKNKALLRVIIILIVIVFSIFYVKLKRNSVQGISSSTLVRLPSFNVNDISGRPIRSREIKGRATYVQFIEAAGASGLRFFEDIYSVWEQEGLLLVGIIDSPNEAAMQLVADHPHLVLINSEYQSMKRIFGASAPTAYYVFDAKGKVIASGRTDWQSPAGLRKPLNRLLKNRVFEIADFVPSGTRIQEDGLLGQVAEAIGQDSKPYHIVVMFDKFCAGCASGMIIERLRDFYFRNESSINVICILSSTFSEQDANNMRAQLDLPFKVIIANGVLSEKWNRAKEIYSENDVTDIVLVIDNTGQIVKASYPNCGKCWAALIDYLSSLPKVI